MADLNTFLSRFLYSRLPQFSNTGSVSGVITASTTSAATIADTNETTLWTYSLPANTLDVNGRALRITAWGSYGATANNKSIRGYFGSEANLPGVTTASNGVNWSLSSVIVRTGAATGTGLGNILNGATIAAPQVRSLTETHANAITIKITGQNGTAAANDIVFTGVIVELLN